MIKSLSILFTALIPLMASAAQSDWKTVTPGLAYTSPAFAQRYRVHAFRINLGKYRLSLLLSNNNQGPFFAKPAAIANNAIIAINGGFFSPDLQPIGLRIYQGKVLHPLKKISWWGIFAVKNNRARIFSKSNFRYTKKISFALQAGPRLVVSGSIPSLKGGIAKRSAIGITRNGNVVIAITSTPLTTTKLAGIMKNKLGCYNALNLDGGSSSQLYARIGSFSLSLPSLRPVADVLIVTTS